MKNFLFLFVFGLFSLSLMCQNTLTISELMYNSPGEDLEFLEFINNSSESIDLSGYEFIAGINYSFPDSVIGPGGIFVITNDALKFQRFYRQSVLGWTAGALSNSGEQLVVVDNSQDTVINLEYTDNQPWSQLADGGGSSLVRCDLDNDPNLPESWDRNDTDFIIEENALVYADPGIHDGCTLEGQTILVPGTLSHFAFEGTTVIIEYFLDNAPDQTTTFLVQAEPLVGAEEGVDYNVLTDTLVFSSSRSSSQIVEIEILEDVIEEDEELFRINLIPLDNNIEAYERAAVTITSCNESTDSKLKLRGVIHSSEIKAIELYVLEDLSSVEFRTYSIGSANNGNGSDGQEFTLQAFRTLAGSCIYVTDDTIRFKQFFGPIDNLLLIQDEELEADFNGDDAIELFLNCKVVDTYGLAEVDGTGEPWEYSNGWARIMDGPISRNPSNFNPDLWTFSGTQGLDAETNDASSTPYPMECSLLLSNVENEIFNTVRVYPNPTDGVLYLDTDVAIDQLRITNLMGQIVYDVNGPVSSQQILLEGHSNEILFVTFRIGSDSKVEKIFIK